MIVVDVLLAANLAVLAVLVVGDRSRHRRVRPSEVMALTRVGSRRSSMAPSTPVSGGVVIPFDRAERRAVERAMAHHPAGDGVSSTR